MKKVTNHTNHFPTGRQNDEQALTAECRMTHQNMQQ